MENEVLDTHNNQGGRLLKNAVARMLKKPQELTKRYYSIGEVANLFENLTTSKIRFWESEFDILNPRKDTAGNRRFTKKDIDHLRLIYHLVHKKGFKLEGARREIKENKNRYQQKIKLVDELEALKDLLLDIKEHL